MEAAAADEEDDEEQAEATAMTPDDLAAARQQLAATGAVLTHRLSVYFVPRDTAPELLAGCANFVALSELQQLRLLRELQATPEPRQEPAEEPADSSGRLMRCLSRHRLLGQMTRGLKPMGRLRSCCRGQCKHSLVELLESVGCGPAGIEQDLTKVARRHLHRVQQTTPEQSSSAAAEAVGNERPFPLAADLSPESLRLGIHHEELQQQLPAADSRSRRRRRRCWIDLDNDSDGRGRGAVDDVKPVTRTSTTRAVTTIISEAELYRPYLNNWTPLEVQQQPAAAVSAEHRGADDEMIMRQLQARLDRQRQLEAVVGGLTWRQKQHRQQRLAVRLATRSALIGLRHSINVQPAKNYLELYVNMISRAVEQASCHVRRWSHCLEHSWKAFKELARRMPLQEEEGCCNE